MRVAKSEADSAVIRAKPDNAVMSVILIRELRLLHCRSTDRHYTPKCNHEEMDQTIARRSLHTVHSGEKGKPRLRMCD